jgi:hypothetical protein
MERPTTVKYIKDSEKSGQDIEHLPKDKDE